MKKRDSLSHLINLRNDIIFKFIFGHEKNERILIALLNAILGVKGTEKITKLTFINSINLKEYLKDKTTTLDVKAEDTEGKRYNIEMQLKSSKYYINRVIYYQDKLFTSQLQEGEDYHTLNKTISISILNYEFLEEEKEIHNIYRFKNTKSNNELTDIKEIHFIELPKFDKNKPEELRTKFEKWLFILKFGEYYIDRVDNLPDNLKNEEEIIMALREMVRASSDEVVRELLEYRDKALHDEATRLLEAKEEGIEEGMAKGIAKGKAEGIEMGKAEIAKKFLKKGFPLEEVAETTGLSVEFLKGILK